jgi:dUTP pyrophosphatase
MSVQKEFAGRQAQARELFDKKFEDYGAEGIARTGIQGLITRMTDKLERLKILATSGHGSVDESIRDTCTDLSNYALMTGMVADGAWPGSNPIVGKVDGLLFRQASPGGGIYEPQRIGDVGHDLACSTRMSVAPRGPVTYLPTGIHIKCPHGFWARLCGRSSTMRKFGLLVIEGVIDTGYTGELQVGVVNMTDDVVTIEPGTRIAQIILIPAVTRSLVQVDALPETERGDGGFGSTGGHGVSGK